jgi:pantothenate kinase
LWQYFYSFFLLAFTANELGLSSDVVACSFGKAMGPGDGAQPEDRARALLMMVTNNIAQVRVGRAGEG